MKTFGLGVFAALVGYLIVLFSAIVLVEAFSSNRHDRSVEAAMTGTFVFGPCWLWGLWLWYSSFVPAGLAERRMIR